MAQLFHQQPRQTQPGAGQLVGRHVSGTAKPYCSKLGPPLAAWLGNYLSRSPNSAARGSSTATGISIEWLFVTSRSFVPSTSVMSMRLK